MIDNPNQVKALIQKLKDHLPISVKATPALIRHLSSKNTNITPASYVEVTDVMYFGDEGGICCSLKIKDYDEEAVIASLTHLNFPPSPISLDVRDYQAKRIKKLARQR